MCDNYGLNDNYDYMELELDSLDSGTNGPPGQAGITGVSPLDWPVFYVGGRTGTLPQVAAIKVLEAQIPFSYYVFTEENGTFQVSVSGSPWVDVTISPGNYDISAIEAELSAKLTATGFTTFTVTYVASLQKLNFAVPGGFDFQFQFNLPTNSGNVNPRLWIGFPGGISTSGADAPFNELLSPNVISLGGPNYLYLNSTKIGQTTSIFLPKGAVNLSGGNQGPQLAKIPADVNSSGVIFWKDPDPQKWFDFEGSTLNEIDLYLTMGNTTSQTPLRLNGLPFSIKLGVLLRKMNNNEELSGMVGQGRVTKRIRPY